MGCTTGVNNGDPFATIGQVASATAGQESGGSEGTGASEGTSGSGTGDSSSADSTSSVETTDPGGSSGGPPQCGNGIVEGDEVCDGEDFAEISCASQGFDEGDLICSPNCMGFSTELCFICGNQTLEGAETCDGSVPNGVTCESEGFTEGTIACNLETCQLDTSGCSLCGNGVAEGNEECDDADFGGATCESLGLIGGDLACDAESCTYSFSGCDSFMEDFESGAIGVFWTNGGNANWIADSGNPIAGTYSGASGVITHNQQSSLSITINFAAASSISFTHEESTESSFDYLRFYIDGIEQSSWSGTNAAAQAMYNVGAGQHTFEWRYTKDGSVNSGQDRVWVDDIVTPGGQVL